MGIFDRVKKSKEETALSTKKHSTSSDDSSKKMFEEMGMVQPFSLLVGNQFNNFISVLSDNKLGTLSQSEVEALDELWRTACIDIDGYGNNIWNLKNGFFKVYNNDDVRVCFEKKDSEVKEKGGYDEGRAAFFFITKDGGFVINQSDRNKMAFLVYVTEGTSKRLLDILGHAEAEVLEIEFTPVVSNERVGIPDGISISTNEPESAVHTNIPNETENNQTLSGSNSPDLVDDEPSVSVGIKR